MKTKLLILALALVGLFSCTAEKEANLAANEWILESMNIDGASVEMPENKPTIMFDDSTRVAGFSGCNRYFGNYEKAENNGLAIKMAGSTMMACPDMTFEEQYLEILPTVKSFEMKDGKLVLKGEKATMQFSANNNKEENK